MPQTKLKRLTRTRFAIVGFGNIGKRHANILHNMQDAELTAVVDIDSSEKSKVAESYGEIFFNSLHDFFEEGYEADVLVVATPNGYHYQQAYQGLERGYHVLVEKPITLSTKACSDLIEKARNVGKEVFCVLQNRYSPPARWLKYVIDQALLGRIFLVDVHCFWNRDEKYYDQKNWRGDAQLDGGTLFTQFSHFIDLILWAFGEVKESEGRFFNFNHQKLIDFEDSGILHLSMNNGAKVVFTYSTSVWEKNMESSISVIGEKGSLKIGGQYMDRIDHCHIKDYDQPEISPVNPPNDYGHYKGSAANHFFVLENMIKALNGETFELARPEEACKSIALIEHVYQKGNLSHPGNDEQGF